MQNAAIEYSGVTYQYPHAADPLLGATGDRTALRDVTFSVREGECVGVLGPNGGGKSTLLKLTLGLLECQEGAISVFGRDCATARRSGLVGYVAQRSGAELAFPLSVRQVIEMPAVHRLSPWAGVPREVRERVGRCMELVGVERLADRPVGQLSGGQLQRVMIARALAAQPRLLLLDEPTVGIDVTGQQRFAELLRSLRDSLKLTIVIVSHDIRAIAGGCDRVACLSRTLHFHDSPQGLTPAVLAEVFRHDVAGIFGDVHIDAHAASACTDPSHSHGHPHGRAEASTPIGINVSMPRRTGGGGAGVDGANAGGGA